MSIPSFVAGNANYSASFDSTASATVNGGSATRKSVLAVSWQDAGAGVSVATGCTYGGSAMTLIGTQVAGDGVSYTLWGLHGASIPNGSQACVATWANANRRCRVMVGVWDTGADVATATGFASSSSTTSTPSLTITSNTSAVAVAMFVNTDVFRTLSVTSPSVQDYANGTLYSAILERAGAASVSVAGTYISSTGSLIVGVSLNGTVAALAWTGTVSAQSCERNGTFSWTGAAITTPVSRSCPMRGSGVAWPSDSRSPRTASA